MVLGDLLDVDEPFIVHNQLGAADHGGMNTRDTFISCLLLKFKLTELIT